MILSRRFIQTLGVVIVLISMMAARCNGLPLIDISGNWAGLAIITESTDSLTSIGETNSISMTFLPGVGDVVVAQIVSEEPSGIQHENSLAGTRNGNSVELGGVQKTGDITFSISITGSFSQTEFSGSFHTAQADHSQPANNYELKGVILLTRQ